MQENKKNVDTSLMKFINPPLVALEFANQDIPDMVDIELHNFDFFFELAGLDETTINEINLILSEERRLPAALGGYHGSYTGGLFDHTLLVVNYAHFYCEARDEKSWLGKVLLTAICHDFGKIAYYGFKLGLEDRKINIHFNDAESVRLDLTSRFTLTGKDRHVENGIAVIKKYLTNYDILFDDEMYLGIVYHHGQWSKYQPHNFTKLSSLIHKADMKASHEYKI